MWKNYIKIAFKVFLRRKFFTFISLFAITFTLTVLIIVSAMFDQLLGPNPPETNQKLTLSVLIMELTGQRGHVVGGPGYKLLNQYMRGIPGVKDMSIVARNRSVAAFKNHEKYALKLKRTDGAFWRILDFDFIEGGPFTDEDEDNARFVAVINAATRDRYFDGQPAVGKSIEVDGQRFRVVGVVNNVSFLRVTPYADIWTPLSTAKTNDYRDQIIGASFGLLMVESKQAIAAVKEEFRSRATQVPPPDGYKTLRVEAETPLETISRMISPDRESRPELLLGGFITLMILFMFIPSLNLVNINISRIMERRSEIGVRKAFGASSRTLIIQFLTENIILTLIGGCMSLIAAYSILKIVSNSGVIPYASFHINIRVFLYGMALAAFFGLISGALPAWKMSRLLPVDALRGGMR